MNTGNHLARILKTFYSSEFIDLGGLSHRITEEVRPFVFRMTPEAHEKEIPKIAQSEGLAPDLPFKNVLILNEDRDLFAMQNPETGGILSVMGVVLSEVVPGKIAVFAIAITGDQVFHNYFPIMDESRIMKSFLSIAKIKLESIPKGQFGRKKIHERFPIKKNKKKEFIRIREVIYIRDKSESDKEESGLTGIEWSHSFYVMGHWRKIQGMGKNRDGERVVSGRTWVTDHVKGEGELINKIRVVQPINE